MTTQQNIPARTVFIVSDGTGITAEALARSVLSQFNLSYSRVHIPFVDTIEKVRHAREQIQNEYRQTGLLPIVMVLVIFGVLQIVYTLECIRLSRKGGGAWT